MAVVQMVSTGCTTASEIQIQEIHSVRTSRNARQTAVITSFATTYPEAFGPSKPGEYHFAHLKTPDAWNAQDGHQVGLRHDLSRGIKEQKNALAAHARVMFQGYPLGLEVVFKTLSITCDWWVWFASALEGHLKMLLEKACQGGSCSKKVRDQCWRRAMGSLKGFFDELRQVRVHAAGAEHHTDRAHRNGTFLHCTFQEMRIMEEFRALEFERHKSVQDGLLEHIYETYQPRDSTDVTPRLKALETKVEAHGVAIGQQRSELSRARAQPGAGWGAG